MIASVSRRLVVILIALTGSLLGRVSHAVEEPPPIPPTYQLTRVINPADTGRITRAPRQSDLWLSNEVVTLTAVPNDGKVFAGWSGDVSSSSNPLELTMNSDKTVIANFATPSGFLLTTTASPLDGGTIARDPSAITYGSNALVTLTATANVGFKFSHWVGANTTAVNPSSVTMTANKTVTAVFTNIASYLLTTATNPPGVGTIVISPPSLSNRYAPGTVVTLTAVPNGTNTFAAWMGSVASVSNEIALTMNADKTMTALFNNSGKLIFQGADRRVALWFLQGTQRLAASFLNNGTPLGAKWRVVGVEDMDGNGSKDVLLGGNDGRVALWRMSANVRTNTMLLRDGFAMVPSRWRLAAAADITQDGKIDLIWQGTNGAVRVWAMNGVAYTQDVVLPNRIAIGWRLVDVADFDANNSVDLLIQHPDGRLAVWLMNGTTKQQAILLKNASSSSPASNLRAVAAEDMNDDGQTDIIFRRTDGALRIWQLVGTNFLAGAAIPQVPAPGWVLKAAK